MIEMRLLPSKETDNKLRWAAHVPEDTTEFKLYIPKSRVPKPWPAVIEVSIGRASRKSHVAADIRDGSEHERRDKVNTRPIRAILKRVRKMVHTVRFAPEGPPDKWELGEPYIPYSLLPDPAVDEIAIEVQWDFSSQGQFQQKSVSV